MRTYTKKFCWMKWYNSFVCAIFQVYSDGRLWRILWCVKCLLFIVDEAHERRSDLMLWPAFFETSCTTNTGSSREQLIPNMKWIFLFFSNFPIVYNSSVYLTLTDDTDIWSTCSLQFQFNTTWRNRLPPTYRTRITRLTARTQCAFCSNTISYNTAICTETGTVTWMGEGMFIRHIFQIQIYDSLFINSYHQIESVDLDMCFASKLMWNVWTGISNSIQSNRQFAN